MKNEQKDVDSIVISTAEQKPQEPIIPFHRRQPRKFRPICVRPDSTLGNGVKYLIEMTVNRENPFQPKTYTLQREFTTAGDCLDLELGDSTVSGTLAFCGTSCQHLVLDTLFLNAIQAEVKGVTILGTFRLEHVEFSGSACLQDIIDSFRSFTPQNVEIVSCRNSGVDDASLTDFMTRGIQSVWLRDVEHKVTFDGVVEFLFGVADSTETVRLLEIEHSDAVCPVEIDEKFIDRLRTANESCGHEGMLHAEILANLTVLHHATLSEYKVDPSELRVVDDQFSIRFLADRREPASASSSCVGTLLIDRKAF